MFAVFDSKAGAYLEPFFAPTRGVAMRSFEAACLSEGHSFARHAEDYTLFEVGEFHEDSGLVIPCDHGPVSLLTAWQVVSMKKESGNV